MPENPQVTLLILGSIFLLISVLGGGFEVSAIRIPKAGPVARLVTGSLGIIFLIIGIPVSVEIPPILPGPDPVTTGEVQEESKPSTVATALPPNTVAITIAYAPEEAVYLVPAIEAFNASFAKGIDPLTEKQLSETEQRIFVIGYAASSGTAHQGIINAILAPSNANVERPTIYAPSVSHWPALVNQQTGRDIFDLTQCEPTALTPLVIAIWESRLTALQAANKGEAIGWADLVAVLQNPDGWQAYGLPGRQTVYYGHTDPYISSTGLSTLVAEFYASARDNGQVTRRLTLDAINDSAVQSGVREIEAMIKHYSERTTEFKEYIAQGPDYLDFVALEENDLIYINQGKTDYQPPEKLVALYPKEGTFWHEHPFCIPNAPWVTAEARAAAQHFTRYVRTPLIQREVMAAGFRPVLTEMKLGYPFVAELGVDPLQPQTILEVPEPSLLAAIQASWQYVKKQADILLVIDVSGSMAGSKLANAQAAAHRFLDLLAPQNRVGLLTFNEQVQVRGRFETLEVNEHRLRQEIDTLQADGGTALYDALAHALHELQAQEGDRIRAVIVLSDGQDTGSLTSLQALTQIDRGEQNPLLLFPVAYGFDADIGALNRLAQFSSTKVLSDDEAGIQALFALLSSYF